jgi:hypothetical protein
VAEDTDLFTTSGTFVLWGVVIANLAIAKVFAYILFKVLEHLFLLSIYL